MESSANLEDYLEECPFIDWKSSEVYRLAWQISKPYKGELAIAEACFKFVRDNIKHSWDHKLNPVTFSASEVLRYNTGFCYAKSHLLAALLRANGIPTGLCYQRLTIDSDKPPFCLHGLNALFLAEYGWYRVDARGNREDVNAQFSPPVEQLAFPIQVDGEKDFSVIYRRPPPLIVESLQFSSDYRILADNLPDPVSLD